MASPHPLPQLVQKQPDGKFQDQADLLKLLRSAVHSQFRQKADDIKAHGGRFPRLQAFLPKNLWPWVWSYLKFAFGRKHPFISYLNRGEQGVYPLAAADGGQIFKLSIAGDWATGTREASNVALGMQDFKPDYTIHLGDVYYVGDKEEINENCFGQPAHGFDGVTWPTGTVGSFALNGNHEMYANGDAYFDYFIKTLGVPSSRDHVQLASFFCLENAMWRILGLDTGYNSVGLPILGEIPLIKKIPFVGANCKLEKELLQWLDTTVKVKNQPKATIVLTHHQYFSAFDEAFTKPARQLQQLLGNQAVIWIWGHEHRFAVYDKFADGALPAYGRCLGHGGMPVELKESGTDKASKALQFHDSRKYAEYDGTRVGFNGFLNLKLAGNTAELDYRDVNNLSLLTEQFIATGGGQIAHQFILIGDELTRGNAAPQRIPAEPARQ